jgi:hypothetical protein
LRTAWRFDLLTTWNPAATNPHFLTGRFPAAGFGLREAGMRFARHGGSLEFPAGSRACLARNTAAAVRCWNSTSPTRAISTVTTATVPCAKRRRLCICRWKNCACGWMSGLRAGSDGGAFGFSVASPPCIRSSGKSWPNCFATASGLRRRFLKSSPMGTVLKWRRD